MNKVTRRVWKVAPGTQAKNWPEQLKEKRIGIGSWGADIPNFLTYTTQRDIERALESAGSKKGAALLIWRFTRQIKIGDLIVASKGEGSVVGVGVVTSDYIPPMPGDTRRYPHSRNMEWIITEEVKVPFKFLQQTVTPLSDEHWKDIKTAYLKRYPEMKAKLESLDGENPVAPPPVEESDEESVILQKLRDAFARTNNLILYGPPGTGKTYWVRQFANEFTSEERSKFVTFHQSFAYEEFVEGLKPLPPEEGDTQIRYGVVPGVFRKICEEAEAARSAQEEDSPKYLLVIDEINRANIAKVFGELITLIEDDKRLGEDNEIMVTLPYSGEQFGVPPNLYILGTMNTADRSIALLDLALRRRFTFLELKPDPLLLHTVAGVDLNLVLTRLNERVAALLDCDHMIGHSYFHRLDADADADDLRFEWFHRVVPLLQEYFYNDGARLHGVLGEAFVRRVEVSEATATALAELYDPDTPKYEIVELSSEELVNALLQFVSG